MDDFVNDLLAQTGATVGADLEVEQQLKLDLAERAATLINRRLVDALPEDRVEALNQLLDERPDDVDAYQQFISDNVPSKDEVVAAALYEFRVLYLGARA